MRFQVIPGLTFFLAAANVSVAQNPDDYVYGGSNTGTAAQLVLNGSTTISAALQGWCVQEGPASVSCNGRFAGRNYLVGSPGFTAWEYRNWFSFAIPLDHGPITSALLRLNTHVVEGAPNEVTYYDVADPAALGTDSWLSYLDQASGLVYGSRVYTDADEQMVRDIQLNATAMASIQASAGGNWALAGDMNADFAAVPEPGSMVLLATGLAGVLGLVRRRRKAEGRGVPGSRSIEP